MKPKMIIAVEYRGEKLELQGRLKEGRYGYGFVVKVEGGEVVLEPDKEGKYKVSVRPAKLVREGKIDVGLVMGIKGVVDTVK